MATRRAHRGDRSFEERWIERPDGRSICVLIRGDVGWLLYLREPGDAGLSSRDPAYDGPPDRLIEFRLSNGQVDSYPAEWVLPVDLVERALEHFEEHGEPAPFVTWNDDGED